MTEKLGTCDRVRTTRLQRSNNKTKTSNKQDVINLIVGTGVHKCMCLAHSQGTASSMQIDLAGGLPTAN